MKAAQITIVAALAFGLSGCLLVGSKKSITRSVEEELFDASDLQVLQSYQRGLALGANAHDTVLNFSCDGIANCELGNMQQSKILTELKWLASRDVSFALLSSPKDQGSDGIFTINNVVNWDSLGELPEIDVILVLFSTFLRQVPVSSLRSLRVLSSEESLDIKDEASTGTYTMRQREFQPDRLRGAGGIGQSFDTTSQGEDLVVKFLASDFSGSGEVEDYLKAHQAIFDLCKDHNCGSLLKVVDVGVSTLEFRQVRRPTVLLERGESNLQQFFDRRWKNMKLEEQLFFLRRLLEGAKSAFQLLRENKLCHMDADLTNFIVVNGQAKLGDFDTVSSLDGQAFGLKSKSIGRGYLSPPELGSSEFMCRPGYDEFYFAKSLVAKAFDLSFSIRRSGVALNDATARVEHYRESTFPKVTQALDEFEEKHSLESRVDWKEVKASLTKMLGPQATERY